MLQSLVLASALILLASMPAMAGQFRAPLMQHPPVIDGKINPGEWDGAVRVDGFVWNGSLERRRVTGWVGATSTHLYLAIRSQLPAEGELLTDIKRNSENVVYDDAVEFWIDPTPGAQSGARLQLLMNSAGYRFWRLHPYGATAEAPSWRGTWDVANSTHDGWWDCEVSIPIADVAPGRQATDGVWGINLCRDWKQNWAWSALGADGYSPTDLFSFVDGPGLTPGLEQRSDPFTGNINAVLTLRNPGATSLTAHAVLSLDRDMMPPLKTDEDVEVPAGLTRQVTLAVQDQNSKLFKLTASIEAKGDPAPILSRTETWTAAPGAWRWVTHKKVIAPLDFQFAYYPYRNLLRLDLDVSNLPHDAILQGLQAVVRKVGGAVVATLPISTAGLLSGARRKDVELTLPPLDGDYEIAVKASGQNVPAQAIVKTFQRQVFPWEHNQLGLSHKVYPPFTPIRVVGKRVSTVLREHTMGDDGLWDQVTSRGVNLLAAPMRWEVTGGGAAIPVKSSTVTITRPGDDSATAKTQFTAGPLKAHVLCTWDYDGTMRVDLKLSPIPAHAVDGLTLVIPLKASQATLYHAIGDGIRNTLYAPVPPGNGVVWTSRAVQCSDMPAGFCTYLYVGTPVRGLCWFAENDRGWAWDRSKPDVDLFREGDEVLMRVHLINMPATIDQEQTITFGLLAAPVKPRLPANWRYRYRRDHYSLLGTDINWLALGDCGSVYPAGKDMFLWQMIARGNREHLSGADIQKTIDEGLPYFEPYGQDLVNTFKAHVRYNLTARYGTKMIFYYNRASYQAADEFQTFQDEWDLTDMRTVGAGNSRSEIKIVPSESYIDHALYWYGKSFDIGGNQGVYWDNWFFVPSYNTEMTPAYRQPDGAIVPATGLWGLRELAKRTFQYMNERGMPPITMAHMTSTSILPMLSFATVQYDWEWKYSEGDVQYRFPRDYILLVSDGDLAGAWPVVLGDQGKLADDPWTARTYAAVCMVHELDGSFAPWTKVGQSQLALFKPVDEILQQPGVEAFRYWDDRPQPVRANNADLPTIVYSVKGKEAVFAVVSYADADSQATITIDPSVLGFGPGYRVMDTETGQDVPVQDNKLTFTLKKHDVRVCRILPAAAQ